MQIRVDGKVALVTGGSRGIGLAMAKALAEGGARVAVASRKPENLEAAKAELVKTGAEVETFVSHVGKEGAAAELVKAVVDRFGKLDVLVNNAGDGGPTKRVQDYTADDWFYTINSCLTSSYMCTRFAVPEMIRAGGGVIVNISSTAGRRGLPFRIGYCSAKAGQVGMTYGLALELAPHNIRVNAIAPGAVEGDRIDRVIAGQAEVRGVPLAEMRRSFVERAPLKRMTTAEDIATLAVYLCSDAAKNLSGQCIAVTAGEPAV
jgi:NAD(P)-dependent dehydrogenase (short-subunit alcohol dehydrogenase family)